MYVDSEDLLKRFHRATEFKSQRQPSKSQMFRPVYARIETETIMLCLMDMPIQTLIPPNRLSFHSFSEMFTSFPFLPALDSIILHR